jgi:flagellar operon protein
LANNINNILIPNVTKTSQQKNVDVSNRLPKDEGKPSEFKNLLSEINSEKPVHGGINLSTHAAKRLSERKIDFNGEEYLKVKEAIAKLSAKGSKNSLVITDKAAYVVDVANEKVITAVDKMSMNDNVFTKIDSTVFMN